MKILLGVCFFSALACVRPHGPESKETVRLMINHYKVPCVGMAAQLCYLSREARQPAWEFLFEGVEGFQYEWGRTYELEVEKTTRKRVMADQSAISYKLIRIVSSEEAPLNESFPLLIKDADMVAVRKADKGQFMLMGQYPVGCSSPGLCEELESTLKTASTVTGLFRHAADHRSLELQSLEK